MRTQDPEVVAKLRSAPIVTLGVCVLVSALMAALLGLFDSSPVPIQPATVAPRVVVQSTPQTQPWRDCITLPRDVAAETDEIKVTVKPFDPSVPAQCVRIRLNSEAPAGPGGQLYQYDGNISWPKNRFELWPIEGNPVFYENKESKSLGQSVGNPVFRFIAPDGEMTVHVEVKRGPRQPGTR